MTLEVYPPLFAKLNASVPVKAVFGSNPLRVYPIGEAPAKGTPTYGTPYATFQTVAGAPENNLATRPDAADFREQVDVMATTLTAARNGAKLIMEAIELVAAVVSYNGERKDTDTQLAVYSFDIAWITTRT